MLWIVSTWWLRSSAWKRWVVDQAIHWEVGGVETACFAAVLHPHQPLAAGDLERGGRVVGHDPAVDDEGHSVAKLIGGRHVVGGEEDRAAAGL